ncbi:hypothetical protein SAMN05216480_101288 [Pustulibacterium marinum]|uniref:Uncharacterized protein n=1 Tax=Pustulibacterium marinum TaxID=1224947 RepID=A0A1I7EVB3_9FLAO|nr:hypothetical protein [Pustulibacterium marinum]SFU27865.1 hypothetical protein SAMN05216480_101288 [Pustulibacterium marinum]
MNCENCNTPISGVGTVCHHCQFPYNGTIEEKDLFYGKQISQKQELQEANKNLKKAANSLFVVAGIMLFNGIVIYLSADSPIDLIFFGIVSICLLTFGFLLNKAPSIFIIAGLSLITLVYILLAIANGPEVLFKGIIFKIIIYTLLIKALVETNNAKNIRNLNKSLM